MLCDPALYIEKALSLEIDIEARRQTRVSLTPSHAILGLFPLSVSK